MKRASSIILLTGKGVVPDLIVPAGEEFQRAVSYPEQLMRTEK